MPCDTAPLGCCPLVLGPQFSTNITADIMTLCQLQDINESFRTSSSKKKQKFSTEMKTVVKLEKSRQSARECRARKKLRYQYLDDLILERERANERLRGEMSKFVGWCEMIDQNSVPEPVAEALNNGQVLESEQCPQS